jgi:hypothetical protein
MPTVPTPHDHVLPAETLDEKDARLTVGQPTITPTGYVASCLPEGHDERWTFTIQIRHVGHDRYTVKHSLRFYGTDGTWTYEPSWDEDDPAEAAWQAEHRFDRKTALRLAREQAPLLTYRGRTVADALTERCDVAFVDGGHCSKPAGHRPPGSDDPHTP